MDDIGRGIPHKPFDLVADSGDADPVSPPLELLGDPLDELVDGVSGGPPVGRDLNYREALD
jgi:hypothetical protein